MDPTDRRPPAWTRPAELITGLLVQAALVALLGAAVYQWVWPRVRGRPAPPPAAPAPPAEDPADALRRLATDPGVSDEEAIRRYLGAMPRPFVFVNLDKQAGRTVEPDGAGGWLVRTRDPDQNSSLAGMSGDAPAGGDPWQWNRTSIGVLASQCDTILTDLKGRKVSAVVASLSAKASGGTGRDPRQAALDVLDGRSPGVIEVFRVRVTPDDLPQLRAYAEKAPAADRFDPRKPDIDKLWTVELNDYPNLSYTKTADPFGRSAP